MTPAEWLAALIVASWVYTIIENLVDPRAIEIVVNNNLAACIRIAFALAILVAALVVLL